MPGGKFNMAKKPQTGGPLRVGPKTFPKGSLEALQYRRGHIKDRIQKMGGLANAPKLGKRLENVKGKIQALKNPQAPMAPTGEVPGPTLPGGATPPSYNDMLGMGNQAMAGLFGQIQNQGAFNPGNFADSQQKAYDSVYNQFQRSMQPQFDQEEAAFRQQMVEQGTPVNSDRYEAAYKQMKAAQNSARQNAMDQAFQTGLGAQGQAYGQAANTYQMPYQNMGAFTPFFQGQNAMQLQQGQQGWQGAQNDQQRQFEKEMAALQQKYQMKQLQFGAAHQGGGGGGGGGYQGMSLADQMALQNNSFYNNMALMAAQGGQQMPLPGMGSGFGQGMGTGIGMAVTGSLLR